MTVGFGSPPTSTNGFKKPLLSARQLQELAKTFSHLNIETEEEELMRAVRKVDLGWNKRKHLDWNKVKERGVESTRSMVRFSSVT